jgi:hypothetical protein
VEIDRELSMPLLRRQVVERHRVIDGRHVDDHVQAAQVAFDRSDDRVTRLRIGHIRLKHERRSSGGADGVRSLLRLSSGYRGRRRRV